MDVTFECGRMSRTELISFIPFLLMFVKGNQWTNCSYNFPRYMTGSLHKYRLSYWLLYNLCQMQDRALGVLTRNNEQQCPWTCSD